MNNLFQNVLTASFHGSIVILAVLVLRLLLRRSPKKYVCMLWLLVGIRLLMPFELESRLSLQPQLEPVAQMAVQTEPLLHMPPEMIAPAGNPTFPEESPQQPVASHTPDVPSATLPLPEEVPETVTVIPNAAVDWNAGIPWVWLTVALAFALYSVQSYLRLKRKVRLAVKIPGGWECSGIETAFILGFVKPKIYIPTGISRENRRHILAHERTHLEKGDHWIKMLGYIALAIHWFNPLVWVSYFLLCRDIEMACDERVVRFMELEERKRYSAALLSCSTNKAHFAACPVAFGEVNVKQRILSVLNYRKPSFWISLVSIIAIVFVAVCLVTSPSDEDSGETEPSEAASESTGAQSFTANLTEAEVAYTCEKAIEALKAQDSYYITHDYSCVSTSSHYGSYSSIVQLRRAGKNVLFEEDGAPIGGTLIYDGMYGFKNGGQWVWQYETEEIDTWLDAYTPAGKTVTFPEGTGVVSGDTLSFHAQWKEDTFPYESYEGIFTFTFAPDGSLTAFGREYTYQAEDGGEVIYSSTLTVRQEDPALTEAIIRETAENAISQEQLDAYLKDLETITEVPSNKTSYDKDYALGAGSKQWKFFGESNHVRIGAEDLDSNGLTLVYSEADDSHTGFRAEAGFWLEQLVDGTWILLEELEAPERDIQVSWTTTDRYSLSWEEPLGAGFYRIGRYHTLSLANGESETAVCYAKFRLYNPDHDQLLREARAAWDGLFSADSYRLYCIDYMTQHSDFTYYMTTEVWKSGADYLMDTRYVNREDPTVLENRRGSMWRGGVTYDLEWADEGVNGPLGSWNSNTYMDEVNFTLWSFSFEWYDSQVEEIRREGNNIIIQSLYDFDDVYEASQIILALDNDGSLVGMRKIYLPTRDCAERDKVVDGEMVVLKDTAAEVRKTIDGVDLNAVPTFSWDYEQRTLDGAEGVRTKNFTNTSPVTLTGAQAAIDRALRDCTLPAEAGMEPGCNMYTAYFDKDAQVWKVECTASWDDSIYQAIYMDSRGVTLMSSTIRPTTGRDREYPIWLYENNGILYVRTDEGDMEISSRISEEKAFTCIITDPNDPGKSLYIAVGGTWTRMEQDIGWLWWERENREGLEKAEGWISGGAANYYDPETDQDYAWFTNAKNELGTPFSDG